MPTAGGCGRGLPAGLRRYEHAPRLLPEVRFGGQAKCPKKGKKIAP